VHPLVAATMVVFLLSLAGIPLTAGFLSKFYMLKATINSGNLWLAVFAVMMAAVSVYYYFKLIQAMYFKEGKGQCIEVSNGFRFTLVALAAITILLGIFPGLIINWIYF
jgi:NADH-quinone oxidoreductase subunit N